MPTYKNNRNTQLIIDRRFNSPVSVIQHREIQPGEYFIAHSSEVPERWLVGNPLEGPWVTLMYSTPTDHELSS